MNTIRISLLKLFNKLFSGRIAYSYVMRGIEYEKSGNAEMAQKLFKLAHEIDPTYVYAASWLEYSFYKSGQYDKALAILNNIPFDFPDTDEAWYNLGYYFAERDEIDKAIDCYETAIKINPQHADAHLNLGNVFRTKIKDYQKAMEQYDIAYSINPNDDILLTNIGNTLADLGKYNEAIEYYKKAIKLKPDIPGLFMNLGLAQLDTDMIDSAEESFKKATELDNNYPRPHYYLGKIYRDKGLMKAAIEQFERAASLGDEDSMDLLDELRRDT